MMPDERRLIERAGQGDQEAFTRLVRQYQNRIFGFIMRMTANREAALDLTQDTLLAAWQNIRQFRQEASFSTWLCQIAVNKTRNYLKKADRETPLADGFDQATASGDPESILTEKRRQADLLAAVGDLPPAQRAVFDLRFFEHLKFDEIARIQQTSVSAAKTSFAEALKKLKRRLEEK